jgi:hypothetical protein
MGPTSMTTRQWIIVVVAVALALFLVMMERRASSYHRRAQEHYVLAGKPSQWETRELRMSRNKTYHIKMMQKWMDAQRHPWISVEPDPGPPEPEP